MPVQGQRYLQELLSGGSTAASMGMQPLCCASAYFTKLRAASLMAVETKSRTGIAIHALAGEVKGRRTAAVVVTNHLSQIHQAIDSEVG
jgi:hypothetical protein